MSVFFTLLCSCNAAWTHLYSYIAYTVTRTCTDSLLAYPWVAAAMLQLAEYAVGGTDHVHVDVTRTRNRMRHLSMGGVTPTHTKDAC